MQPKPDLEFVKRRLLELYGSREGMLAWQLILLSQSGQPCDVTFYKRGPILDVRVPEKISTALMYGAGAKKLQELFNRIEFSDGTSASFNEIWMIYAMPHAGISQAELNAVDLSEAEKKAGNNGETIRKMISDTYRCTSRAEEDRYIRRFFAS